MRAVDLPPAIAAAPAGAADAGSGGRGMLPRLTGADARTRAGWAESFRSAEPFPHLVLDDVLAVSPAELLAAFPATDWDGWHRFTDAYQAQKLTFDELDRLEGPVRELVWALNAPRFLELLEEITGIEAVIPDPYLKGGGLHCSGSGGVLAPHSDFHDYPRLGLFRRINVIVYLNPGWQDEWGGALELYGDAEATQLGARVPARWGRMVIFRTDVRSVHGFAAPVPPGQVRRSVATYYYTAADAAGYSGDSNTVWRTHAASGVGERAQLVAYRGLVKASMGLSYAAHALNPSIRQARLRSLRAARQRSS